MLSRNNFLIGEEARGKLIKGIKTVASVVGGTMGTGGQNVLVEAMEMPNHFATNDGATIIESMHFADHYEEMGRNVIREAVSRANKQSGDGSSTTCVLTAAILEEGMKHTSKASPMEIKRSLEACIPLIEESINKQKREITVDEVGHVASISAEDEGIGARIQEIYQQIGKEGIVYWDISKTSEDSYTIGKGVTIEGAGYFSPYMCDADTNGNSTNQIRINKPTVLITKQKITTASDFGSVGETLNNKDIKDVIVFCDEVDPLVVPDLIKTRMVRGFRFILVKMPTLWKDVWYEDIAKASGATIIDPTLGLSLKNATTEHLGTFENIVVTKQDTYIDGIKDISTHIKALEDDGSDESKLRLARLNTKTARYFVGAHSDSALAYRRLKVEDAISSAYHALNGGVVAGGGVALEESRVELPDTVGGNIMKTALRVPQIQIVKNAGIQSFGVPGPYSHMGVDTRTGKVVNMFDAHITDPAPVVLNAVKNAISVAASILTCSAIVTLPREETPINQPPVIR